MEDSLPGMYFGEKKMTGNSIQIFNVVTNAVARMYYRVGWDGWAIYFCSDRPPEVLLSWRRTHASSRMTTCPTKSKRWRKTISRVTFSQTMYAYRMSINYLWRNFRRLALKQYHFESTLFHMHEKKKKKKPNRSRVLVVLTVFPSIHKSLNILLPPLVFLAEWRPVSMWVDKNNQLLVVIICVNYNNYVK